MQANEIIIRSYKTDIAIKDDRKLSGYASVFYDAKDSGTQYDLVPGVFERIAPTAFNNVVEAAQNKTRRDVLALYNHDKNWLLGRSGIDTLRLSVDSRGLHYEVDLPDTSQGRDIKYLLERGDLWGCSFAAVIGRAVWTKEKNTDIRTIARFSQLIDVSIVTQGAYQSATATLREYDLLKKERNEYFNTLAKLEKINAITHK